MNAKDPMGLPLKRPLVRTVTIRGQKRTVHVEDSFWNVFKGIAANKKVSTASLVAQIDEERGHLNLSRAIRLFVLDHFRGTAEFKSEDK